MPAPKTSPSLKFVIIGSLLAAYLRLVYHTTRWTYLGKPYLENGKAASSGFIIAFWHARISMMTPLALDFTTPFYFLISEHKDGEYIAQTARYFNVRFARGSSLNPNKKNKNKSGSKALRQLVKTLRAGNGAGLTPDGPRGPRQKCQPGVIALAKFANLPVLPAAYATSRTITFNTWDKFKLPLPFGKGIYVFDAPVDIHAQEDRSSQEKCRYLEAALNTVTRTADTLIEKM